MGRRSSTSFPTTTKPPPHPTTNYCRQFCGNSLSGQHTWTPHDLPYSARAESTYNHSFLAAWTLVVVGRPHIAKSRTSSSSLGLETSRTGHLYLRPASSRYIWYWVGLSRVNAFSLSGHYRGNRWPLSFCKMTVTHRKRQHQPEEIQSEFCHPW